MFDFYFSLVLNSLNPVSRREGCDRDVTVTFEDICSILAVDVDVDHDLVIVVDVELMIFKLKFVSFG